MTIRNPVRKTSENRNGDTMKPISQTLLTVIIGLVMISAFVGVYYVDSYYAKNTENETLFITDSNVEFPSYPGEDVGLPYNMTTSTNYQDSEFDWVQIETTPIYIGNNTWGVSQPASTSPPITASGTVHYIVMEIPFSESWYVKTINISVLLPATLPNNSDFWITLGGNIEEIDAVNGWVNYSWDLTTYESLNLMQLKKADSDWDCALTIHVNAPIGTTLPAHAYVFTAEITGNLFTSWSMQNSIDLVMGICVIGNIMLIIYMTDAIDFNAKRKDLPGKTRVKSFMKKRKSVKRKR